MYLTHPSDPRLAGVCRGNVLGPVRGTGCALYRGQGVASRPGEARVKAEELGHLLPVLHGVDGR